MAAMEVTLKKYFGFSAFRPYQKEVIEKILEGKDCLVVMATGSGKSLCYQVPPLIAGRTGIVVSPLLSLMQDQVMALKQRGIKAEYLGSTQSDRTVQTKAESGSYNLLFMTPEKALAIPASFWTNLLNIGICLFAVDEAHCISEWGHDFRVEYKKLDKLRPVLSNVPFVSLTATATEKVRLDIINSLKLKDPYIAVGSFDRSNLFYGVKSVNRGYPFLNELVQEVSKSVASAGSTIIYCSTIKDVEQIHQLLQSAGIKVGIYHGQLDSRTREETHRLFIRDELRVVVATIAFGMGIDKPDIRHVIHYGCPKSLETYYQESGRCGRDGIASVCWLYYTRSDFAKSDFYCSGLETENQRKAVIESLRAAEQYCSLTTCRRKFLLEHFGEKVPAETCDNHKHSIHLQETTFAFSSVGKLPTLLLTYFLRRGTAYRFRDASAEANLCRSLDEFCQYNEEKVSRPNSNCDNCTTTRREHDVSREAFLLMTCIQSCRGNWGLNMPVDVLRGSRINGGGGKGARESIFLDLLSLICRSRRIVDAQFDRLPLHGLGKAYSSNWWKTLGSQLITHGYLKETTSDVYRFVSVSAKGAGYLKSAAPDCLPSLLLPLIDEMHEEGEAPDQVGGSKSSASECEGLSESEAQLYHALLEERMKLARATGTAPYAVCGDATIKKIALVRPSTRARLANIDGVNQHLVVTHGDCFLQTIRNLSQELKLSLDGEVSIQNLSTRKVSSLPSSQRKLTPAKFEAWKMWHEDGLSIQKTANFPGRSVPIKEGTVLSYLLEAVQEGCDMDWPRLCDEIELTSEMFTSILDAIKKVGSTEKMKPIKDELPENISYSHLKTCLTMMSCGISSPSKLKHSKVDDVPEACETSPDCLASYPTERSDDQTLAKNGKSEGSDYFLAEQEFKVPSDYDSDMSSSKRCKVDGLENDGRSQMVATQSSVIQWMKNNDEGVALHDILKHFKGSSEGSVQDLLVGLETDFLIYQKNGVYRLF